MFKEFQNYAHITFIIRKPAANIWERKNFKQENTWAEYQTLKRLGAYNQCIIKHSPTV